MTGEYEENMSVVSPTTRRNEEKVPQSFCQTLIKDRGVVKLEMGANTWHGLRWCAIMEAHAAYVAKTPTQQQSGPHLTDSFALTNPGKRRRRLGAPVLLVVIQKYTLVSIVDDEVGSERAASAAMLWTWTVCAAPVCNFNFTDFQRAGRQPLRAGGRWHFPEVFLRAGLAAGLCECAAVGDIHDVKKANKPDV